MINEIVDVIVESLRNGNKLLFIGNGGSASQAEHLAAEFVSDGYPAIALTNSAIITAIGNDYGYESVFTRQLQSLAKQGDIVIALSTSGESENILDAVNFSVMMGYITVAITSCNSSLEGACDFCLDLVFTEKNKTQEIQEKTIKYGHQIWKESIQRLKYEA